MQHVLMIQRLPRLLQRDETFTASGASANPFRTLGRYATRCGRHSGRPIDAQRVQYQAIAKLH